MWHKRDNEYIEELHYMKNGAKIKMQREERLKANGWFWKPRRKLVTRTGRCGKHQSISDCQVSIVVALAGHPVGLSEIRVMKL